MTFSNNTTGISSILVPYFPEEFELLQHAVQVSDFFFLNVYPFIFGMGSLWNSLIIVYFVQINSKNLKNMSSYHFLIIHLAVVDLCTIVGLPIVQHFTFKPSWEFGAFGCIFFVRFIESICPVSRGLMLVISAHLFYQISIDCLSIACENQQKEVWILCFHYLAHYICVEFGFCQEI